MTRQSTVLSTAAMRSLCVAGSVLCRMRGTKLEVKAEIVMGPMARAATKGVDDNLIVVVLDVCSFELESRVCFFMKSAL